MHTLTAWLIAASRTWWLFGSIFVLNAASFQLLFALEDRFETIAGVTTFDTQNDLTPAALLEQLPRYAGAARVAYGSFAAFDWVFPFIASSFLAVLWAWLLRTNPLFIAQRLLHRNMPVWAFAVTIFDWLENTNLLLIVYGGVTAPTVVQSAVVWKQLKLAGLAASGAITMLLLALAVIGWLRSGWRARTPRTKISS